MTKTKTSTNNALVLLAAGSSERMGKSGKKEYLPLSDGTVLSTAAVAFLQTKLFSIIAVVHPKGEARIAKNAFYASQQIPDLCKNVKIIFTQGGATRQESVLRALEAIKKKCAQKLPQTVLIHDGARPFLSSALVAQTLKAAQKYGAATPALEPVETQKEIDSSKKIARHLERKNLASVQTPQGFDFEKILQFHRAAKKCGSFTDDTEIWDKYAQSKTRVIKGESKNIKITYPQDIEGAPSTSKSFENNKGIAQFRIGLGYDLHRLVEGRPLVLGGVEIPSSKGEEGHSDGDALLHAITDALLGAAAIGDIGSYFPDTDDKWLNADSKKLLAAAWRDVRNNGWQLENLDCIVKLQQPKFLPYRERVCQTIAKILGVQKERVFVKAKTGEDLGEIGCGNAVECEAICLIRRCLQCCAAKKPQ